jgi:hypothetical protein
MFMVAEYLVGGCISANSKHPVARDINHLTQFTQVCIIAVRITKNGFVIRVHIPDGNTLCGCYWPVAFN